MAKIKPEHYSYMRDSIESVTRDREKVAGYKQFLLSDSRVKDVAKRFRWDCLWAARLSPWISSEVYPYANDEHIDTALRSIIKELGL